MEKKILLTLFTLSILIFAQNGAKAQIDCALQCPSEAIAISVLEGESYVVPDFLENDSVTFSDECAAGIYSQTPAAGSILQVGEHWINVSLAFDGDTTSCTFPLVIDDENQGGGKCVVVVCPQHMYVTPDSADSNTVPDFFLDESIFFGGCEPTDKTQSPAEGTVFSGDTLEIFLTYTIDGVSGSCNFSIILDQNTGVNDLDAEVSIVMYPNPARDEVNIESSTGIQRISIYDITGKEVLTTASANFDVSLMNKGMYFVEIKLPTGSVMRRLVVE